MLKLRYREERQKQLDKLYREELEKKTISYNSWIQKKEENSRTPISENIKVGYYIFVEKKEDLLSLAERELTSVFQTRKEVAVIYADEDEVNSTGRIRMNPRIKPDFSPDTLLSYFYFGSMVAVKKEPAEEKFPFLKKFDSTIVEIQDLGRENFYQGILELCLSLKKNQIYHIRKILYSSHNTFYWGYEEEYDGIKENLYQKRDKVKAEEVSIIIPSKDNPEVLKRCLDSIKKFTRDISYEIILVDNGSRDENKKKILEMQEELGFTYLYEPMEFNFSRMCNLGSQKARFPLLLFLNDDCEVRTSYWLNRLVKQSVVKETGAVGVKLYYPDSKRIQHCGIYHIHMGPAHKLQFKEDKAIYYDRRNRGIRNVLAVTAACLMVRKEVFEEIRGFDEEMKVAFNDVDLCYRIYKAGYNNVVDNENYLWHHESLSRGSDDSEEKQLRFRSEKLRLYEKHPDLWKEDPYYHPYFTTDILDTDYSFSYEYEGEQFEVLKPEEMKSLPKKIREDSCVAPLIEYSGDLQDWFLETDRIKELEGRLGFKQAAYLQGSLVVIGSDNAIYEKYMVFHHEKSQKYYYMKLPCCYRPDIERNLLDQTNVALAGFSLFIDLRQMEAGRYYLYVMVKDRISGQYILRKTSRFIERK